MEKLTSKERAKHQPKSFSSHDLVVMFPQEKEEFQFRN